MLHGRDRGFLMAKDKKKDKKKAKKDKAAKAVKDLEGKAKKDGKKAKDKLGKKASQVAEALRAEVKKAGISLAESRKAAAKKPGTVKIEPAKTEAPESEPAATKVEPSKAEAASTGAKHASTYQLETFEIPAEETLFNLASLFKIFSDPTRLNILFSLVDGPRCVADISAAAGVTQGATSHQLRSMKQEHLVDFERDGKQVFYSLADNRVQTMLAQGLSYIGE